MSIKVLVVDDQAMVRAGFRALLGAQPDIDVVGEAANGVEAVDEVRRLHPDVVLMDVRMPEMDGLEATRRSWLRRRPRPHVLILTTFDLDDYVYEALRAGASGFLLKDAPGRRARPGRARRGAGDALLAPVGDPAADRGVRRGAAAPRPRRRRALAELTPREREVLELIAARAVQRRDRRAARASPSRR